MNKPRKYALRLVIFLTLIVVAGLASSVLQNHPRRL